MLAIWRILFIILNVIRLYMSLNISSELRADEIGIMQFDSRPLDSYWAVSARWNNAYCRLHKHKYIYYTTNTDCKYMSEKLASPWCKV